MSKKIIGWMSGRQSAKLFCLHTNAKCAKRGGCNKYGRGGNCGGGSGGC